MNQKSLFIILAAAACLPFMAFSGKNEPENPPSEISGDSASGFLAEYGYWVFVQQNCQDCHSLKEEEVGYVSIPLGGISGKYDDAWHFMHLMDPLSVVPESGMPTYSILDKTPITQITFGQVHSGFQPKDWAEMLAEADRIQEGLEIAGQKPGARTEMLALISFLQSLTDAEAPLPAEPTHGDPEAIAFWDGILQDPQSAFFNQYSAEGSEKSGKAVFEAYCKACHGMDGRGGVGPALNNLGQLKRGETTGLARTIALGIPEKGMPAFHILMGPGEVGDVVAYVESLSVEKQGEK